MIPRILHRTVPLMTDPTVEEWWSKAVGLHQDWDHVTWRDPLDPADFPLTADHWWRCSSGAQFAGLVRLEVLHRFGGWYLDSDLELWHSLAPLAAADLVGCWQDNAVLPDAVLAAAPEHPAILRCIDLAIERLEQGAHRSGPNVTTEVIGTDPTALLLPPGVFYPVPYTSSHATVGATPEQHRGALGIHHWHGVRPGGWAYARQQPRRGRR